MPASECWQGFYSIFPAKGGRFPRKAIGLAPTGLLDVEREILGPDPIVGAVGHDLADRRVEPRLEVLVLLAEPYPIAAEGRIDRRIGDEAAAGAFAAVQELPEGELVSDHEVEASGQEIEIRFLELGVGLHLRLGVALFDEAGMLAAVECADRLAGERLRRRIVDRLAARGDEGCGDEIVAAREGDALGAPIVDFQG